jgi:polar amino acid transport system substrate-binding protein
MRIPALIGFLIAGAAQADTVVIRADHWYPMNGKPGDANPGFMIEIAQRTLAQGGHTVDYDLMPWERALHSAENGTIDCVVGAYKSDAPNLLFPENSQGVDITATFVKKGSPWRYSNLEGLKSVQVGGITGYSYGDDVDAFIEQNPQKVQLLSGDTALEQNIRKLLGGRIDVILESPSVLNAKLKELNLQGQADFAGAIGEPENLYIACTPQKDSSRAYIKMISDGTQQLRQSGELKKILEKYGLSDWAENVPE